MSNYLEAIIRQINKTIVDAEQKYYQPSFWSSLRVDYTRATRLVISFDNAISGIVFLSFATNLFFICLQLFYIFSHGVRGNTIMVSYKGHDVAGIFGGYEPLVYFIFSFAFVLCRFLAVSLKAANIHSASLAIGPSLYNLPSTVYCNEIQRFIEQVHGSTVTLSGLQFFHVTKSLILTVAGTIVTYELVLLQFNGE
ncbi:unnamed protein product [Diatraea saccharalis]|uniref:Uncharacterized protein n=1 Tax=Diatraea saccharalis TaxID=40085 RepID=A0A9N9N1M7_9NEOP|nr:unnamed protein product [Diatraea saccharalis]